MQALCNNQQIIKQILFFYKKVAYGMEIITFKTQSQEIRTVKATEAKKKTNYIIIHYLWWLFIRVKQIDYLSHTSD